MANNNYSFSSGNVIGFLLGLGGLGLAAYFGKKNSDLMQKVDIALEDVEKATPVEIRDEMISKAVKNAINKKVNPAVENAVSEVKSDLHNEITKQVRKEVTGSFDGIQQGVSDKIAEEIADINKNAMADRIIPKVEKMMCDKMEKKLDNTMTDLTRKYNDKMESTAKDFRDQFERVKNTFQWITDMVTPQRQNPPSGFNYYGR